MKFRYKGPNMVIDINGEIEEHPANCYGGNRLRTGDTVELNEYLSSKALKNPNYELLKTRKSKETEIVESD